MCMLTTQNQSASAAGAAREETYDAVIVGGGIAGVFLLAEAIQQGFTNVVVLDRKDRIGGLWTALPAWQTVQNDPRDFCVQGFTTKKGTWYAKDVVHMLEQYVAVQRLEPYLHLGREVISHDYSEKDGAWVIRTRLVSSSKTASGEQPVVLGETEQVYRCKKLILCTGKHATPFIPKIPKDDGSVPVVHSSQVQNWDTYKGKRVVVVGAGASALDLVVNSMEVNEKEPKGQTFWVLREPRYFGGFPYCDLVIITILQLLFGLSVQGFISWGMNLLFHLRFWYMGLSSWLPKHSFDLQHEQFVPNRSYLLEHAHRVDRRCGVELRSVSDRTVTLSDGSVIEDVDFLLMGTGYKTPKHAPSFDFNATQFWMKSTVLGEHLGRLWLFGEALLDSTASTPMSVHLLSRFFWTLVKRDQYAPLALDKERMIDMDTNINHMDFANHVAPTARELYPFLIWRFRMLAVHLYYRLRHDTRMFYPDRLLGTNMSLDL